MKTLGYDERTANRLVPLLRSIVREICDRSLEVESLEQRFRTLRKLRDAGPELTDVQARLSANRRGLRAAQEELSRLGCELDPVLPTVVHIRGKSGGLEDGFTRVVDAPTACRVVLKLAG